MLVVDELKKNEPQLRLVAVVLLVGLCILLAGVWWVQVVSAREYQSHLETQTYRTKRLPAMRGKILDREGRVLAENRPRYNLSLNLDDLSKEFKAEYERIRPVKITAQTPPFWKFWSSTTTMKTNRGRLKPAQIDELTWQARYNVVSRIIQNVTSKTGLPLTLDPALFKRHYETRRALPFPILKNLEAGQIARFQENFRDSLGADLELESVRHYPNGTLAGHLLGYVRREDKAQDGESSSFTYFLPDYRGIVGVEFGFDEQLRGRAGAESVLVNNLGYRQSETIDNQPESGQNLVLTIDLDLQQAAETALVKHQGSNASASVVVMDVRNGDVLAMASSPGFNPIYTANASQRMTNQILRPAINRATQDNFAPGSIFKVVVALAALEAGLNPEKSYTVQPDPEKPGQSCVYIGRMKKRDTVSPGQYNLKRALVRSSNSYFIQVGLETGVDRIVALAEKFHLGEMAGVPTRQETSGELPSAERIHHGWTDGDTANLSIGQGELSVTPLQMAVVYSAIANGGKVFWPRLVSRIAPQDSARSETVTNLPSAMLRDQIGVSQRSLKLLRSALLAETEDAEGTGQSAKVPGIHICGKTGTAERQDEHNQRVGYNFWFASFAPYENPKYAVVVMVQGEHGSGGGTCAPIAHDIYEAILNNETPVSGKVLAAVP